MLLARPHKVVPVLVWEDRVQAADGIQALGAGVDDGREWARHAANRTVACRGGLLASSVGLEPSSGQRYGSGSMCQSCGWAGATKGRAGGVLEAEPEVS